VVLAEQEFRLRPGEVREWSPEPTGRFRIAGTLVDADGEPLVRWLVRAHGARWNTTVVTGEDGAFRIDVPDPDATYTLRAAPYDDPRSYRAEQTCRGTDRSVRLVVPEGPAPYGTIRGRIETPEGDPLGGLMVAALRKEGGGLKAAVTAHKDGSFAIRNLPPATWRLCTRDPEGRHALLRLGEHDVSAAAVVDIGTHRLPVGGRIRCRAVAPAGAKLVMAAPTGWWGSVATGAKREEGGALLSGPLAPGTYTVMGRCILDGDPVTKAVEVEVRSGETTEVTIDLRSD